jgi:ABC-2 type transport system permease protein
MPVIMVFIYGYAISYDLKNIDAGIIDYSGSRYSQELIKLFTNNSYFKLINLQRARKPIEKGEKLLRAGKIKEIIVIPADFSRKIATGKHSEIGFIIDGSDSNTANIIYQYNNMIVKTFLEKVQKIKNPLKVKTKVYFNPELKSSYFFVPGLIAILLLMVSALLTSISIAREKETGSLDLIFISPLKSSEIIIGKTIPYIFIALFEGFIILMFAYFWFKIPIRGNLLSLFFFSLLYIIAGLSLGIFISTSAEDQRTAMLGSLMLTMLPSIMLSGFIFPIESLSKILRGFTYLIPATYYLKIIRGMVLKGAGVKSFIFEGGILAGMSFLLLLISTIKFSKEREKTK